MAFRSMCLVLEECTESKKPDESHFLASMMNRLQMGGMSQEESRPKEPSFLEQNLELFMDMSMCVCEAESQGSFYHAQRVFRVCIQEHTDKALTYLFNAQEGEKTSPPPLFRYVNQLLRHVHEPGAIDMLIDLLCLPPRTSESSALSNATDAESQDNLMMMMMMAPTTELLSAYRCSSVVKHKYYKAVSDSEVLVSLVCRAADSRLTQDHADASAEAFDFVLRHLSGDCDGRVFFFLFFDVVVVDCEKESVRAGAHTHTSLRCNRFGILSIQVA